MDTTSFISTLTQAKQGNTQAQELLIHKFLPLIRKYAYKCHAMEFEDYRYGIVSLLELISVQFLCILWAAFRHQIIDYLIFYLIFLILRKYGGGFHFKNFLPCFITSVISIIGLLELMQHIYLGIFPSALISTFSLVLIILISPVPSVVETLSQKEFQLRKHRLTIVAGILELLIILLYFTKQLHLLHVCMVTFLFMTGILIAGKLRLIYYHKIKYKKKQRIKN